MKFLLKVKWAESVLLKCISVHTFQSTCIVHGDVLLWTSGNSTFRRYDSDASVTDSSSMVSGLPSSRLSDGRSSMVSITQGSYAPDSYITDGYESEAYMTASFGSSVSRAAFRAGILK